MRRKERKPLKIANGAKTPNGSASRPRTRALVAARSLTASEAYQSLPPPRSMYRIGPMPQKKLMMIHSTLATPPMSLRLTMSTTASTKAIGCKKIASSTSTRNLIKACLVFHDRVRWAGDPRPAPGRCVRPIGGLLVARLDPAASDVSDCLEEPIHFLFRVVGSKTRANRTR